MALLLGVGLAVSALTIAAVSFLPGHRLLALGVGFQALVTAVVALGTALSNAELNRRLIAQVTVPAVALRIVTLFAALSTWPTPEAAFWAIASVGAVEAGVYALRYRRLFRGGANREMLRDLARYAWPVTIVGIGLWMRATTDRWVLAIALSPAEAGIYVASYQLLYMPIQSAAVVLNQFVAPSVFRAASTAPGSEVRTIWKTVAALTGITSAIAVVLLSAGQQLLGALLPDDFALGRLALLAILIAGLLMAVGQTMGLAIMGSFRTWKLVPPTFIASAVGAVAAFFGGTYFGIEGVVAGSIIFGVAYIAGMYRSWPKRHGVAHLSEAIGVHQHASRS